MKTQEQHAEEFSKASDDDLIDELRYQTNMARNSTKGHDRERVRALGHEMRKRGILENKTP